ncbi:MAG: hypothetical protein HC840_19775 [Leptolyngbyaceae cyanobacterium RM2_2_4]|nr:hypothetical protein [Leptolyngbyaceae cyanobacterium SM1_4_3]NJN56139.1 hypothetical protein [Leptolyngbyaceae cyanobacterium SL_5_9]NJO51307.1 hypothetical protein [Leptolyngbyaceae cyanobacterium RM2_2_4]NJO67352.1 hypothetical protein [Leptolyngbyaceae cyanobacterium RM1_405_57]
MLSFVSYAGANPTDESGKTFDPMPIFILILAIVATFPPGTLNVGVFYHAAFGWLFVAQHIHNFFFSVSGFSCDVV